MRFKERFEKRLFNINNNKSLLLIGDIIERKNPSFASQFALMPSEKNVILWGISVVSHFDRQCRRFRAILLESIPEQKNVFLRPLGSFGVTKIRFRPKLSVKPKFSRPL